MLSFCNIQMAVSDKKKLDMQENSLGAVCVYYGRFCHSRRIAGREARRDKTRFPC